MAYSDIYVVAEAMRGAGHDLSRGGFLKALDGMQNFVAGSGPWSYAADFMVPRSFTATDHQGNRVVTPVVYRAGSFKPVGP
jgi:hypothetical protein